MMKCEVCLWRKKEAPPPMKLAEWVFQLRR